MSYSYLEIVADTPTCLRCVLRPLSFAGLRFGLLSNTPDKRTVSCPLIRKSLNLSITNFTIFCHCLNSFFFKLNKNHYIMIVIIDREYSEIYS